MTDPADNIIELHYDNSWNILYGLHWDNFESREYLVSIDPATGTFTKIDSLPGVNLIVSNFTTFDESTHRYIFKGGDTNGNWYLYSVDANTGNIISSPQFPVLTDPSDNIIEPQFDNASNILYGLHWDNSENREYLVSLDPLTGAFTKIDSIPGVDWITMLPHYTTFDEINHRYIFRGGDNNGNWYLYSVDVITGNTISNPLFPVLTDPSDNVIELQFDNSSGILYALHWDANTITAAVGNEVNNHVFNVYPNPVSFDSKIILDKPYKEIKIFIYNTAGELVRRETNFNSSAINIRRDNLQSGVYYVSLVCDHLNVGNKKIIIE